MEKERMAWLTNALHFFAIPFTISGRDYIGKCQYVKPLCLSVLLASAFIYVCGETTTPQNSQV